MQRANFYTIHSGNTLYNRLYGISNNFELLLDLKNVEIICTYKLFLEIRIQIPIGYF